MKERRKKQNTKERILIEGSRAFVAKSYNGCGLSEILAAAGVPKGSFYHYFKSKEEFGVAVIERFGNKQLEHMRGILNDRSKSPLERLRYHFQWMRDHHCEQGTFRQECIIAKFALETSQLSEAMRIAIKYVYDSWTSLLAKTIREAQQAKEIDEKLEADQVANVLNNLWEGATIRMQIERTSKPLDEAISFMFDSSFLH